MYKQAIVNNLIKLAVMRPPVKLRHGNTFTAGYQEPQKIEYPMPGSNIAAGTMPYKRSHFPSGPKPTSWFGKAMANFKWGDDWAQRPGWSDDESFKFKEDM